MQHQRQQIITIKCKHCGKFFEGFIKRTVCDKCTKNYRRKPVSEVKVKGYEQYLAEDKKKIPLKQHLLLR